MLYVINNDEGNTNQVFHLCTDKSNWLLHKRVSNNSYMVTHSIGAQLDAKGKMSVTVYLSLEFQYVKNYKTTGECS